ncbi:Rpn family recombination-promoting nuclease/putative transposase [Clostridium sp. FP2]|uniref:Rpn family recombination-promoting nuclease/putative transposase n=1 Tax=Clostridium TaxID=1485 RepID=UPI0013E99987|nr:MULTISPECIES: Rpn family recombination-promoting nuclease/putative transposase [Clostridium]MBW9158753.1 Rpn family recombination-promoting nuclease/putative transposase [Clostridium tagluense]MBZ9623219.1 Rpn family recombination-promoting nuclease/putative transposase [Clostridium sp. FP2]WLC67377.1 Rpn family recombination-promoting nuclease/putative transposase [Clostridium tagluense]
MLSTATSASCFLYNKKKEIKRKSFRLPAVVPIVLYNGTNKWTSARNFKDIITGSQLFGDNILDFKYILVDINRYSKEYLCEFKNIASAIFLLDQDIKERARKRANPNFL